MRFPRSKFGLLLAILYSGFAVFVVLDEHYSAPSAFLSGLGTFLATLPASALLEAIAPGLGTGGGRFVREPFTSSTIILLIGMILFCAILVYLTGALLGKIALTVKRRWKKIPL